MKNGNMGFISRITESPNFIWFVCAFGVGGYFLYKKIKSAFDKKANLNNIANANEKTTYAGISINVKELARNAYNAIWGGWGWKEDEEAFVKAVLQCPKEYITTLATEYAKVNDKGKNIYNDALTYLREAQYNQIRHLFL